MYIKLSSDQLLTQLPKNPKPSTHLSLRSVCTDTQLRPYENLPDQLRLLQEKIQDTSNLVNYLLKI